MDTKKEILIVELKEVDGVRKHILKYVSTFSDIESLAKTCRCLCLLISGDPIGRDIRSLSDDGYLTIQFKRGFKNAYEVPILERVNITKENYLFEDIEERNRRYVETIVTGNQTFLELAVVFLRLLLRKVIC
uniref:F-box domain-containing protein n=1 Tax=Strongyloides papillosus TaxID=174720 RepID=A0A0N5B9C7_STREA